MSENKKGPGVGFKIFVWVLSAVIIVGVAIGGVSLMKKAGDALDVLTSDVSSNTESNIPDNSAQDNPGTSEDDSAQETPGTSEDDSEPETPEVEEPEPEPVVPLVNYEMSVESSMMMGIMDDRPALCTSVYLTDRLYSELLLFGETYTLWAPLSYFQAVNPNNVSTCDYIEAFKNRGYAYKLLAMDLTAFNQQDDGRYRGFTAALTHIKYQEVNTKYVAMMAISFDGGNSYEYGTFENGHTYASSARSVGMTCAFHVNLAHFYDILDQERIISDTQYSHSRYFLSEAVDLSEGLAGTTEGYRTYELGYENKTYTMKVGETIKLDTSLTPSVTFADTIIWLRPLSYTGSGFEYSHGVVEVDNQGNVKAIGEGVVFVAIFAGGDTAIVAIKVE